jgi:hypothetical protein
MAIPAANHAGSMLTKRALQTNDAAMMKEAGKFLGQAFALGKIGFQHQTIVDWQHEWQNRFANTATCSGEVDICPSDFIPQPPLLQDQVSTRPYDAKILCSEVGIRS